ncbi:2-phospho-L-lactate guanylyltransferase [Rhodococcus sp. NPDC058532]|uniref:2-phospho-L-lactate guanylyltransferase n=1 Tax=Rhodococcus sp. NPDC058532 TaxID=3346540 RepID=UPI00366594A9
MTGAPPPSTAVRAHVVIAVKDLGRAKSRLASRLDRAQRAALVLAMLRDTLAAARSSDAVAGVTVITPDAAVAAVAETAGAAHLADPDEHAVDPLNSVLHSAARRLGMPGVPIVALQGDLPCLSADELTAAVTAALPHRRAVVVDHHGTGTAALIAATAADLAPQFGADSARKHIDSGAAALTGNWPGLRLDVDTPADLDAAAALGAGPETARVLRALGW